MDDELSTRTTTELVSISNINDKKSHNNPNNELSSYILSDADDELLILIGFKQNINLKSISLYSNIDAIDELEDEDISSPKQLYIYKLNNLDINFDDIDKLKPDKSMKCSNKKLSGNNGQIINLQKASKMILKFSSIKYLATS